MTEMRFRRNLATFLKGNPWLVKIARRGWRFGQAKFTLGVVGVVFNPLGELLLVEHVFHPYHPWGLPGGWVDKNEDPITTVQRELKEELELVVDVGPLLIVSVEHTGHLDLAYLCTMNGNIGKLSTELLDYRWVSMTELPNLHSFQHRAIQQAITLREVSS